tara:strand:+ start:606 stop:875 length:270 start_codon:yes stop_codon:yes gene_type:complete
MAYKQEPGRAPMDAYSPFQKVGLIKPPWKRKKKNKKIYGQTEKYLTEKQKINRGVIAPIVGAVGTVLLANQTTRQKIGKGIKNVVKKFF